LSCHLFAFIVSKTKTFIEKNSLLLIMINDIRQRYKAWINIKSYTNNTVNSYLLYIYIVWIKIISNINQIIRCNSKNEKNDSFCQTIWGIFVIVVNLWIKHCQEVHCLSYHTIHMNLLMIHYLFDAGLLKLNSKFDDSSKDDQS